MNWALLLALLLCGCAETDFYRNGQLIARFQGDMTGVTFHYGADGSIDWTCTAVSHSAATQAWGTATSGVVGAAGVAAIGAMTHLP